MIRIVTLILCVAVSAQQVKFKTYPDLKHGFSFDIPENWLIRSDTSSEYSIGICDSTTDNEIDSYKYCGEGIIFRIENYNSNLDSTLSKSGLYRKIDSRYVTSDRTSNNVQTEKIKGKNWIGIYHKNVCGVTCIDEETRESQFHAAAGQCEYIYFSNDKRTIRISTNGIGFDEIVLKRLMSSFKFNE